MGVLKVEGVPEEPVRWTGETPIAGNEVSRRMEGRVLLPYVRFGKGDTYSMTGE